MSSYLVRIELHAANYQDYESLHRAMAARGFARTIRGDDGATYTLPTAEYVISTPQSGDHVHAQADAAASSTGRTRAVLVAEHSRAWWSGLAAVTAA